MPTPAHTPPPEGAGRCRARFEAHLPLLERVAAQVLTSSSASIRDMIYLGACVLWRVSAEFQDEAGAAAPAEGQVAPASAPAPGGLSFRDYAEVALTSELLHHAHYPVPVLQLPPEIAPYVPRLDAMAQALAALLPPPPTALVSYAALQGRQPVMWGAYGLGAPGAEAPGASAPAKGPNVGQVLFGLVRKRLPLILGLVLATEIGIVAYTVRSPKTYVAATTLNSGIGQKDPINGGGDWFTQGTIVANVTELLKSRTVLENTAGVLGLATPPEKLGKSITVNRIGSTGLLKIEAEASSAEGASELANTLVREFLRYYAGSQSHEARSNKSFFESQVTSAESRLRQAEGRLMRFKGEHVPEMFAGVPARVSELIAQRDETARQLAAGQAGLAASERELARIKADPALSQRVIGNAAVLTAEEKLRELQMNLIDAREIYGPDAAVVVDLKRQIARARSQLHTTAQEAVDASPALADATNRAVQLRTEIAMNSARLASLNAAIAQLQPQARTASTAQVTYEQLMREVKIAETQYTDLATKFNQSSLAANGAANLNITIVDAAIPPAEPESSKLALKLALGLILSAGLGLFLSYLLSLREKGAAAAPDAPDRPDGDETPKLLRPGLSG